MMPSMILDLTSASSRCVNCSVMVSTSPTVRHNARVCERSDPPKYADLNLHAELRKGLTWVYGHRMLAPLALASHAWFLCTAMVSTVYVLFVIDGLGFDAAALGLTFAVSGVGAVIGSSVAERAGARFGVGPAIVACRWSTPAGYALIPLAHNGITGLFLLCSTQFLFGLSIGVDSPLEMGYRQSVTPDRLLGPMNATMRSINRAAIVIGAPVAGVLAAWLGTRATLWVAVAGLLLAALALTASNFRDARLNSSAPADSLGGGGFASAAGQCAEGGDGQ
jgi:predicted MFS family arabinose efflux permease